MYVHAVMQCVHIRMYTLMYIYIYRVLYTYVHRYVCTWVEFIVCKYVHSGVDGYFLVTSCRLVKTQTVEAKLRKLNLTAFKSTYVHMCDY